MQPDEIRGIFGSNLRLLSSRFPSIAGLCRELGINRTQYNRYLSGESFPRPDVLHRICQFFDTDARILLEPVGQITPAQFDLLNHPEIAEYLGANATEVGEDTLPSGFYRFSRRSFVDETMGIIGLVYVFRRDGCTFVRGYEAREAMRQQGLDDAPEAREFRGIFINQEDGVAALISRKRAMTCTFNFLARVPSFDNNFWEGYVTRTVRDAITGPRVTRMVYEHLGGNVGAILDTARRGGLVSQEDLTPFHRRLLRLDQPFR
ncbi:helix-turn-helix domain-containing protein [Pseudooceanicola aestuarii]|uniref:helix-turn-helix domain-containing protein n=1 Tax=Pseudooceanicola aestuarii TaxID=2697319 RepID=UPI0013D8BE19|nr:helix-turn-helix transcriptional regulator [Pseudooceanicola aestuarii]